MNTFARVATTKENSPRWQACITRRKSIYQRENEIRSEFGRDYTRLLHSKAYRRLKHKTQVFFAANNDHVCTRIEHVNHVSSVSYTIAQYLELNTELVLAIAIGHDIGHAPFGHDGEYILRNIAQKYYGGTFFHEQNGLFFADNIELLQNEQGSEETLNLTYAVRDGIVSHCGEMDDASLFPREEYLDLSAITEPSIYNPFTWEACIVKVADKISYLGRDLEDAIRLKIIRQEEQDELKAILSPYWGEKHNSASNTSLIHSFATDLCLNSSPEKGIMFSERCFQTILGIKEFNYKYIYKHPRLNYYKQYAALIINSIFDTLNELYNPSKLTENIENKKQIFPKLIKSFEKWLMAYSDYQKKGDVIYPIFSDRTNYQKCIVDFISSMSDSFAIEMFNELTTF
ncbi:MAG: HD domain-containing protein [Bacteroidales bacterium]|jgi:dGTPase|nr:HD domain-containing protein [Bacteroidales bacterium]